MTSTTAQALLPAGLWLLAALVCLLLEAAGTPIGARKRGARTHLPWVIALAGGGTLAHVVVTWSEVATPSRSASGLIVDRPGLLFVGVIALLVVSAHSAAVSALRAIDEERGEMSAAYAATGAAMSAAVVATDTLALMGALALAAAAQTLLAAPDREGPHGIEAALKGTISAGAVILVLGLAALFLYAAVGDTSIESARRAADASAGAAAAACLVLALALCVGAVPVQQSFVDVAHGASSSSAGLLAGGNLVVGGAIALRMLEGIAAGHSEPRMALGLEILAALTLIGAPVAALDQTRVGRVVAYLVAVPGGLMLAACAAASADPHDAVTAMRATISVTLLGATAAAACLLGVVVPRLDASSTWEEWSGFGRRRPVVAGFLVYALACAVGIPGTPAFGARLDVARSCFDAGLDLLGLLAVATSALGAAPLVRLALFFFAKEPPPRAPKDDRDLTMLITTFCVLVVGLACVAAWPWLLGDLVVAARR